MVYKIVWVFKKLNQISKGTLQKINIIQALLSNGEILIFDEPFNGLDKKTESNFISLLKKGKRERESTRDLVRIEVVGRDERGCDLQQGIRHGNHM